MNYLKRMGRCLVFSFITGNCFLISGWFEWINFFCYLERIRHYIIKAISFRCFNLSLRLFRCCGFWLLWMVLTRPGRLLNWCRILMLSSHLKFLICLIRCFELLLITKVFYYRALELHLLSDIFSLAQIFFSDLECSIESS